MLLKPKSIPPCNEDLENKLLIEKWMKRNSSSSVMIGQNFIKSKDVNKTSSNNSKTNDITSHEIEISISNTKILKTDQNIATSTKVSKNTSNEIVNKKRSYEFLTDEVELSILKTKTIRRSLPVTTEFQTINKNICTKLSNLKANVEPQNRMVVPSTEKRKYTIEQIQNSTNSTTGTSSMENKFNNKCTKTASFKENSDVYSSLLDNYRYLITPKSWSVSEFISETKDRLIVFFNAHVIKENGTLISVIKKSLIINKEAIINYSVHGLPVNIKDTILPEALDSTKKLLSILHIFDKMQICHGLGGDLNIKQTDFVFKDSCRFWRHKHCKIVLIKATRCSICTETRNLLLHSKGIVKKNLFSFSNKIKQEKF